MKRFFVILLAILLFTGTAYAGPPDLSDWTYEQLVALQHYITAEIMSRPEWKEITVPSGKWVVGVDIPEGEYSIYPAGSGAYLRIIDNKGNSVISQGVRKEETAIGKIKLKEAYTVTIESGSLIFRPAIVLGF